VQFQTLSNTDIPLQETWRNYALVNVSGIFGPMLAGHMADYKFLGRKYTMVIGALITSEFYFILVLSSTVLNANSDG
jgi:sugar phosphate permease